MAQTQLTLPAPRGPLQHVDQLSDMQIDALIDAHLFGHALTCSGPVQFQYSGPDHALYRCVVCGAAHEHRPAANYFEHTRHPRQIPRYHVEEILDGIRLQKKSTQFCFAVALTAGGGISRGSVATQLLSILMSLTARRAAIAALKAINIINGNGALLVRIE